MKRWPELTKQKARKMRQQGASFSEIKKELQIPKSTLSLWVQDIEKPTHLSFTNQKAWLSQIRTLASEKIKRKREKEIDEIITKSQKEVQAWDFLASKQVQKALLSMLYWAEGQKLPERGTPVRFANTDPKLILLFVTILKNCYPIDPKKINVRLYIHWYHKEAEVKKFWKDLLNIEDSQFRKVYRKKRSKTKKFKKNFMGICFVTYHSVNLRQEIVHTAFAIQEQILNMLP